MKRDMNNEEKKKRKHGRLVEQIADGTKQNKKRQKVYAVPRGSQFCKSGLGILRKDMNNEEKSESVMDTKQSADGTKYEQRRKEKAKTRVIRRASRSRTTRNGSRTARSRTRKDKRYMRFPVGPNSVSLG
ncbi:hypothetical protein T09_15436 [Trichinella sp. T9]|nr:hypothetical protein T09_15436 [Trichinella sp. T9]